MKRSTIQVVRLDAGAGKEIMCRKTGGIFKTVFLSVGDSEDNYYERVIDDAAENTKQVSGADKEQPELIPNFGQSVFSVPCIRT